MEDILTWLSWVLSAFGAANAGTVEVFGTNLLTDVLMLSTELEGFAYVAIGVAGAFALYQLGAEFLSTSGAGGAP